MIDFTNHSVINQYDTVCTDANNRYPIYFLAFLLIYLQFMFVGIMSSSVRTAAFAVGSIILITISLLESGGVISTSREFGLWIIISIYAQISHVVTRSGPFNHSLPVMVIIVLVLSMSTYTTKWSLPAVDALLLLCTIHALATIIFYFDPELYNTTVRRTFYADNQGYLGYFSGLTSHYSVNGQYLAYGTIITASKAIYQQDRKVARLLTLIVFMFALFLTTKRAHIIYAVFAISACYLMAKQRGRVLRYIAFATILLLAFSVLSTVVPGISDALNRVLGSFEAHDFEELTTGRTLLWEEAIRGWTHSILFGNGWSSFRYLWPDLSTVSILAHNELLQLLYEVGLVGALTVIVVEMSCLVCSYRAFDQTHAGTETDDIDNTVTAFAFSLQVFSLLYAYTSGCLLQNSYFFIPYFLAVAISFSYLHRFEKANA